MDGGVGAVVRGGWDGVEKDVGGRLVEEDVEEGRMSDRQEKEFVDGWRSADQLFNPVENCITKKESEKTSCPSLNLSL